MIPFTTLTKIAQKGQRIQIKHETTDNTVREIEGIIVEIFPEGILFETVSDTSYIQGKSIVSWVIKKSGPGTPPSEVASNVLVAPNPVVIEKKDAPLFDGNGNALNFAEIEIQFSGNPVLPHPMPSFDFPQMDKEVLKEIDRWRNRYNYAQKVREPARLTQDVAQIAELAESLGSSDLFSLAGNFAYLSGLGLPRAKKYYEESSKGGSLLGKMGLASIFIEENDWLNAANNLIEALLQSSPDTDYSFQMRTLGQCLRLINKYSVPGLGNLLLKNFSGPTEILLRNMVLISFRDDPESLIFVQKRDYQALKSSVKSAGIFIAEKPVPIKNRVPVLPRKDPAEPKQRQGRITAFYRDRGFGFLFDDSTGQTWYFRATSIVDDELLGSLEKGSVKQFVSFTGDPDSKAEKYPAAQTITSIVPGNSSSVEKIHRAPLGIRLAGIPKDRSSYAKAKRAEQLDQLTQAEKLFREEILVNGVHKKSAIKDLATLLNRKGLPEAAIDILAEHRATFTPSEMVSLDQLLVNFLVKARRFSDAAQLLEKLGKKETRTIARLALNRQEAYCYFADGDFPKAIEKLEKLIKGNPRDNATILLLQKVKQAQEAINQPGMSVLDETVSQGEESLNALASGLSSFSRWHIEKSELRGVDARAKESQKFSDRDFIQVEKLVEQLPGHRARERADYLLTLTALCDRFPEAAGNRSLHVFLRRFFLEMARAGTTDGTPKDVVRAYAIESLALSPPDHLEPAMVLLLNSYSTFELDQRQSKLQAVLSHFQKRKDDWGVFINDAPFYFWMAPSAMEFLEKAREAFGNSLTGISREVKFEKTRVRNEDALFQQLQVSGFSVDKLRGAREILARCSTMTRFSLDKERLLECVKVVTECSEYALERHFRERETRYLRLEADINRLLEDISNRPTHLSVSRIIPAMLSLVSALKADFGRADSAKPILEIRNVLDTDFYVVNNGAVGLRLLLTSRDESAPPVEAIDLAIAGADGEPCHSPEPLHGGQSRELELTVYPTDEQVKDGAFTVGISCQYRTRNGDMAQVPPQALAVRLSNVNFEEIKNPYSRYSGGSPVEDSSMFFGRKSLIEKIVSHVTQGDMGQCFVVYGQKRSGKSSILKQVEKNLPNNVVFSSLSAGTFDPSNLWKSFARLFVQELEFRLEDKNLQIPQNWPTRGEVEEQPVEVIRDVTRKLRKSGHHIVVAIDEFTYVYENSKAGIENFMRGWKALLEGKAFNSILVGQDTMPRFKQAYPNEFGVTHDERITYLSESEASDLADLPLLLNGTSRYRGKAINRLFELTSGSPFFLQIFCDRLVKHLNMRQAPFITEADIEQVKHSFVVGGDALPPERFDALVTAAGEKVALVPRENLWAVLARIARESLHSDWCYRTSLQDLVNSKEAVKDLVDREVLFSEGDRVSIRVGLFSAWLRANQ